MLEYLLLYDHNLKRPRRLRLTNGNSYNINYELNSISLTVFFSGTVQEVLRLPAPCIAIHNESAHGGKVLLLGYDGQLYQMYYVYGASCHWKRVVGLYGSLPRNLKPYLGK